MTSPLEDKPEILQKIGLFIVLFNGIDARLGIEFYYIINQTEAHKRPILTFLETQDFSKKLDMLKLILGEDLYEKIKTINEFRNFIAHGLYGMDSTGKMSIAKITKGNGKYRSIDDLDSEFLDEYISKEREALNLIHGLGLKRMAKKI
jgi:Trp operon repressor